MNEDPIKTLELYLNAPVVQDQDGDYLYNPGGTDKSVYGWRYVAQDQLLDAFAQDLEDENYTL